MSLSSSAEHYLIIEHEGRKDLLLQVYSKLYEYPASVCTVNGNSP